MHGFAKTAGEYGAVDLIEVPEPTPGPGEALVEVGYAGLCGSDLGVYKFKDAFEFMTFPRVMGHEYAGTVVEVGENVTEVEPGQQVVEEIIRGCGDCYQCRSGTPNLCIDARITGIHHDGAFAPYLIVPEEDLHAIPEDMSLREAAITEPTAVAARAVTRNSRVRSGTSVLVEGPGPIGLLMAQIARDQGGDVIVSGVGPDADYRLPLAEELGFDTVNAAERDVAGVADERTDGVGFDVVLDATGHESGLRTGADAVKKGGQIVVVGLTGETTITMTPLVRGEVDIQCSYTYTWEDFETAIDCIRSGVVDTDRFIDDSHSLRDGEAAFEAAMNGETVKPVFDLAELREA